jgi:RNA polymerase sigma-70 factor (family 1)
MQHLSDHELYQYLQQKQKKAFNLIFERYWELLFNAAFNMVKDEDSAKDIVQEIFMQLWQKNEVDVRNLKAYLMQMVRYKSYRYLQRSRLVDELLIEHHQIVDSNNPEVTLLFKELNGSLKAITKQLPERCQKIFHMSRFEQLSNTEIADRMNIKTKTVENQINKAINFLRQTLTLMWVFLFTFI